MKSTRTATAALDGCFLETRGKILEIAANLDRIAQASGIESLNADRRKNQMTTALEILLDDQPDKAKRCQMAFSLPFDASWHERFERT